jgi:K+/H+ antiporter YhaU regulatory subunit KhtT
MKYLLGQFISLLTKRKERNIRMLAEGLNVFRTGVHSSLVGKAPAESGIRSQTGCSVIAINRDNAMIGNPDPALRLQINDEMIMIGTDQAEKCLFKLYAGEMDRIVTL